MFQTPGHYEGKFLLQEVYRSSSMIDAFLHQFPRATTGRKSHRIVIESPELHRRISAATALVTIPSVRPKDGPLPPSARHAALASSNAASNAGAAVAAVAARPASPNVAAERRLGLKRKPAPGSQASAASGPSSVVEVIVGDGDAASVASADGDVHQKRKRKPNRLYLD